METSPRRQEVSKAADRVKKRGDVGEGGSRDEGGGAGAEGGGEWGCFANVFDISASIMSPAGCSETCDSQGTQNTHSTKIKSVAPLLSAGARNTKKYISPVFRTPKKKTRKNVNGVETSNAASL